MKHIISLSLKYIRRQKLRTVLTFLCVTLSVFILCSFGAYIGSTLRTVLNQCSREGGSYEVCINNWLDDVEDTEEALDIIKNHVVISDYYTNIFSEVRLGERNTDDGSITYIDFSDGINSRKISGFSEISRQGNEKLIGEMRNRAGYFPDGDGVSVPYWLEDMGYSVGDTLTFRIQPVTAEVDEDSPEVKEIRQKLLDEFGSSWVSDDKGYEELDYETRHNSYRGSLKDAFSHYGMDFDDIPVKNEKYGEPAEITVKISEFEKNYISGNFNIMRSDADGYLFNEFYGKNPDISYNKSISAYIRINENIDFDEGLMILYDNLGFNKSNYYSDLPETNDELLFFEFRSVGAVVKMLPLLLILFVLIFFAWLVARFVIDNAFEISNQERSLQYASLRIMGASKAQISALVFTEALFYTVTAVPIGTAAAYLLCNMSFTSFRRMGFQDFEFKANPYFAAGGIILCIAAIFISAYTSAMWAARKLSPAEALNFGKPEKKYKKSRRRKSKINLGSKQFLRRYTSKNIMRSKGRYIISTITMTFGVLFFTFSLMLGLYFYSEIKDEIKNNRGYDFKMSFEYTCDMLDDAESSFRNEEIFSDAEIYASRLSEIDKKETFVEEFEKLYPYDVQLSDYFIIKAVSRHDFDENMAELSGMTYDEFLESGGGIYFISSFGQRDSWIYNDGNPVPQYDEYYRPLETPLGMKYRFSDTINIIGAMYSDFSDTTGIIIPIDSQLAEDSGLMIYINAEVNGQENYEEAEKIYSRFIDEYNCWDYSNNYMTCTGLSEFISAVIKVIVSFMLSIWLVGILSMVNSINTSVLNRSRELMMLRSIGMSRKQLRKTVVLESVMFSSVSSSIGIILALIVYFLVMLSIGVRPVMLVSMGAGLIISIAVNIAISALASVPALRSLEKAESLVRAV